MTRTTSDSRFRAALLAHIVAVLAPAALVACGDATNSETEEVEAPEPFEHCIAWPAEESCASAVGGNGGGGGGAGPCPVDPQPYMDDCGVGFNSISQVAGKPGQCCYEVTYGAGRPLLIDGGGHTARPVSKAGWDAELPLPDLACLDHAARAQAADAWTREALLEHASVASFSVLALDLLALGAPADLVAAVHRAALDEVRHARICFALASAYAGRKIAPGTMPALERARPACDPVRLAVDTIVAGCVGETLAACVLAARAQLADPPIARVLARIAEDEARHAALAWRIVAWAIADGGEPVESAAREALEAALAGAAAARESSPDLSGHGHPPREFVAAAEAVAIREVIIPAARRLFAQSNQEQRTA